MKIFLDANILVTVLCNEYPRFTSCARILSLCDDNRFSVYTSPICLAIAFYFAEKKNGTQQARKKLGMLTDKILITTIDEIAVRKTNSDKAISDFEDGLEYYSAFQSKCKCIVTDDTEDFHFSEIEILNAQDFLLKYVAK